MKVVGELMGNVLAKLLDRRVLLSLADLFILLFVGVGFESLPRQSAFEEVDEDVTKSFEIVTARLLTTKVGVDAHVASGTGERLAFAVRDVSACLGVAVLFGHAKINDVDDVLVAGASAAHKEVVGLDVSVDVIAFVDGLNTRDHLLSDLDCGLDGELAEALVEEVF